MKLCLLLFVLNVFARNYTGYRLLRLYDYSGQEDFDIWKKGNGWMDVMVSPTKEFDFSETKHKVLIHDIQADIDLERKHRSKHSNVLYKTPTATDIFKDYQDYDTLISFLDSLPLKTSKISIGKTFLGRDIYAFNFGQGKKRIIIHGGIHAREWIAPAVVTWIAYWLNTANSTAQTLLEEYSWSIIPVLNVDGYDYTRSHDRLWRKNRQPNPGSRCAGVDPNRNFGFQWGTGGSSSNPCDDAFRGYSPNSVPCTVAITDFVSSFPKGEVLAYFDFHSYSQLWLYPFGYNCNLKVAEFDIIEQASKIAISTIEAVGGTKFVQGPICNTIYKASGSSTDHMYSLGVPLSFGVELRDKGRHGFLLPPDEIIPSGREMVSGLSAMFEYILKTRLY